MVSARLAAMSSLTGGVSDVSIGASSWKKNVSTSGTRISSECAIPAQSESRSNWLRIYQVDSVPRFSPAAFSVGRPARAGTILFQFGPACSRHIGIHQFGQFPRHEQGAAQ